MRKIAIRLHGKLRLDDDFTTLGFPRDLVPRLHRANLRTIRDLTKVTAEDLLALPRVGAMTVQHLRRLLMSVGLAFKASPPKKQRAPLRAAFPRHSPPVPSLTRDAARIADLGLEWNTTKRCAECGIRTVGQLRRLSRGQILERFGRRSALDLLGWLRAAGLELASDPQPQPEDRQVFRLAERGARPGPSPSCDGKRRHEETPRPSSEPIADARVAAQ